MTHKYFRIYEVKFQDVHFLHGLFTSFVSCTGTGNIKHTLTFVLVSICEYSLNYRIIQKQWCLELLYELCHIYLNDQNIENVHIKSYAVNGNVRCFTVQLMQTSNKTRGTEIYVSYWYILDHIHAKLFWGNMKNCLFSIISQPTFPGNWQPALGKRIRTGKKPKVRTPEQTIENHENTFNH